MRVFLPRAQQGATLIEAILFIVILGVAGAALIGVYAQAGRNGALLSAQAEARHIAHALMQEVLARPARCGSLTPADGPGPEAGETRASPYDNVNDYHGYDSQAAGGLRFLSGEVVDADADGHNDLMAHRARISVTPQPFGGVPPQDGLRVTVTVTPPVGGPVVLEAWRFCYRT